MNFKENLPWILTLKSEKIQKIPFFPSTSTKHWAAVAMAPTKAEEKCFGWGGFSDVKSNGPSLICAKGLITNVRSSTPVSSNNDAVTTR